MSSLPLVQVNLSLKRLNLLRLQLKQSLQLLLLMLHVLLLLIVLIHEDSLVGGIEFLVEIKLVLSK